MANKSNTVPSLSDLTIQQILNVMRPTGEVLAVGKYQAIPVTFKAWISAQKISTTTVFTSELQEKLGDWLISGKRPKVAQYVFGSNSVSIEDAQLELAKEFASIPVPYRVTRPKGAAGKTDPGAILEAGQSYYFGIAGNRAVASSEKYQNALKEARRVGSLGPLKQFIARGEGNYDALNRGTAGDTSTYSTEYYNALSGIGKPSPTATPVTTRSDYIEKIYKDPFKTDIDVRNEVLNRELPLFKNYLNEISKADGNVSSNYLSVITEQDLQGEFLLIDGVNSTQAKQQTQVKNLLDDKLKAFSPDAKYLLINSALFEMLPDNMRNKMSENSATGGANPNFSHAWRAPGKLSVTADFTIPGIAGLRIGQIFWIDRISEAYKSYGAFQLFGLTENIDIGKGWTTSIHSRFNALPRSSKAKYLIDSSTDGQTVETATNATSQAK